METWNTLKEVFLPYGINETLLLYWFFMCADVRARFPDAYEWAKQTARWRRVDGYAVAHGPPFEAFYRANPKDTTHSMMFGGNGQDAADGGNLARAKKDGRLGVPMDQREYFHRAFYDRMKQTHPMKERYSVVEIKRALSAFRIVIDVDFKVQTGSASMSSFDAFVDPLCHSIREVIQVMYSHDTPVEVWYKRGAWRVNTKSSGEISPWLRGGVHFYTNVVADELSAKAIGAQLRSTLTLPRGMELDEISFTGGGVRMDGSHKIVVCPMINDLRDPHVSCKVCFGQKAISVAAPYALDSTYDEWRRTLLCPLPDEKVWEMSPHMRDMLTKHKPAFNIATRARADFIESESKRLRPTEVDGDFRGETTLSFERAESIRQMVYQELRAFGMPTRVWMDSEGNYFISTKCTYCPFKQGSHNSSTQYLYGHKRHRTLYQRCRHPNMGDDLWCHDKPRASKPLMCSEQLLTLLFGPSVGPFRRLQVPSKK